jgi:prefoldin subunit 5
MTLQDVEEQINNLQAEIEVLKETIEEVTNVIYNVVSPAISGR